MSKKKQKSLIGKSFAFLRRSEDGTNYDLIEAVVIGPQCEVGGEPYYNVALECAENPDYAGVHAMQDSLIRELLSADQHRVRTAVRERDRMQQAILDIEMEQRKLLHGLRTPRFTLQQIGLVSDPGESPEFDPEIPF
jgi:hypothetical protein